MIVACCVDLVAGVDNQVSIYICLYTYVVSMECCDVVNELLDGNLTVSHGRECKYASCLC